MSIEVCGVYFLFFAIPFSSCLVFLLSSGNLPEKTIAGSFVLNNLFCYPCHNLWCSQSLHLIGVIKVPMLLLTFLIFHVSSTQEAAFPRNIQRE